MDSTDETVTISRTDAAMLLTVCDLYAPHEQGTGKLPADIGPVADRVRAAVTPDPLAFSPAYRLITDTSGVRHLVDGGGVRYFTEEQPGSWYIAVEAGNWAAWQGIAGALLETPEPQR
jgi:hypothetical protein